ncbi:MAG: hypothetical protein WBA77_03840 [Microcoleaceae cyanobacterium]
MSNYLFSAAGQAMLNAGQLNQVTNAAGQLLPLLRNPENGQFVEMAKSVVSNGNPLSPLIAGNSLNAVTGVAQMYQNHQGFKAVLGQLGSIQSSLGVLQASTAFIGVGVVATTALSAVNLWQTLKLKKEVKQLRVEVKDGFIDLKQALRDQGLEIIQHINQVAEDIEFKQHRLEYIKAYARFTEAVKLIKVATSIEDLTARNVDLSNARQTLAEYLAIYNSPHLLSETSAPGKLRRYECAWLIEQIIGLTYQLQNEMKSYQASLVNLQEKIIKDSSDVIKSCENQAELDFIYPEITYIYHHDLAALKASQAQTEWILGLPADELKLLESADFPVETNQEAEIETATIVEPPEFKLYQELQEKSHYAALKDQLLLLMQPELRQQYEKYVTRYARNIGFQALNSTNLNQASDLAIANLYWYFKVRNESAEAV